MKTDKSLLAALILIAGILPVNADSLGDLRQSLSSADRSVRAAGLKQFTQTLGTVKANDYAVEAIPVLLTSLADSDAQVRKLAITGLLMVAGTPARSGAASPLR